MTNKKNTDSDHHWEGLPPTPDKSFGFIYVIENLKTGKKYLGKKQFWKYRKRKNVGENAWRYYQGSSKYLTADIKEFGKECFSFTLLHNCTTRASLTYLEAHLQHENNVLTERFEDTDERSWYNQQIGGVKFIPPVECSQLTKRKLSKASKGTRSKTRSGPYKLYYRNGTSEIINMSLAEWAERNGYSKGTLSAVKCGSRPAARCYGNKTKPHNSHVTFENDVIKIEDVKS